MSTPHAVLEFPEGFLWGASTSSHQIEGGNINDWSEWEQSDARRKILEDSDKIQKFGLDNYISGKACDSYNRYAEDFTIARSLRHTATRISLEWSRIQPHEGEWNEEAIAHYRDVITSATSRGLQVFVTLWHFTLPIWIAERGGWLHPTTIQSFTKYAKRVVEVLGDLTPYWISINEPEIYAGASYYQRQWPPQHHSIRETVQVAQHLIAAHKQAYTAMKYVRADIQVGIAKNNTWFEAAYRDPISLLTTWGYDKLFNHWILHEIRAHQDFIGLNHYVHNRVSLGVFRNHNRVTSDMGWELLPKSIEHVLLDLKQYKVPIFITEHGVADAEDSKRPWFLVESLRHVHNAIQQGADIRGYLHWSLLDNFEWDSGFWPRFGLVEVDRTTLTRTPRHSAYLYKAIIEANGLTEQHLKGAANRGTLLGLPKPDTIQSV